MSDTKLTVRTILTGIAFSPNLRANFYEAARLSAFFKAKLILVHVGVKTVQKEEVLNLIIDDFKTSTSYSPPLEVVWKKGKPVPVILEASYHYKADILILGALQKENLFKYYMGSIARKLTRKAPCSVLLLIKPSVDRKPCDHIVVNGLEAPQTKKTIYASFDIARLLGSRKITIIEEISNQEVKVMVQDDRSLRKATLIKERITRRETLRVQEILNQIPDHSKNGIIVRIQSIFGRRGYSIGHYADLVRADLLIMNTPGKTRFIDRFFPHDLEYILSELPTDVLILKTPPYAL
ncbi:universal stress protein [Ascidiimonas aurantiaca]|uniref:universal stress protein n=1 Tax=Ascidiimonas aurantiaca TaxID=1685432 RepID=UPI0030EE2560